MPEPLLAAARVLLRYQTKPGGELARRAELSGIADTRHDGGRGNQADPGDLGQSPACFAGGMPGEELLLDQGDLFLDRSDLRGQALQRLARQIGQSSVGRILDPVDQVAGAGQSLRSDDAELAAMPAQRIDQHRALPNQKLARSGIVTLTNSSRPSSPFPPNRARAAGTPSVSR